MACQIIGSLCSFNISIYIYALIGGILPALLWLWFWFHEENDHHEPKGLIILTFLTGMATVFLAIPLQHISRNLVNTYFNNFAQAALIITIVWAGIEEFCKYISARFIALRQKYLKHPIDAFIYMTTAALGFSAMENTKYLLAPLFKGSAIETINAASGRFMGASLLHFLTCGIIALMIGMSFYASRVKKWLFVVVGYILATLLHSAYNFFIMSNERQNTFLVFLSVWVLVIMLIISLERIKAIKKF